MQVRKLIIQRVAGLRANGRIARGCELEGVGGGSVVHHIYFLQKRKGNRGGELLSLRSNQSHAV
jgi:hypothetical protein